jgi:phospholipid/cholesterol/gamma-HCH transport system ATP-binding protein
MPPSPSSIPDSASEPPIVRVRGLRTRVGGRVLHDGLDLELRHGEVLGVVGGSGSGKSVLLRTIIGLMEPEDGSIEIFGEDIRTLADDRLRAIEAGWGVLFQDGALFSSLTAAQNVALPLREQLALGPPLITEIALLKLALVGLPGDTAGKYPAELSGGMRKRAGLARALALDPRLLFLDEPTAGLDPIAAGAFDTLIHDLRLSLGLTVFMVTHDIDSLVAICDRIAVLVDKRLIIGTMAELLHNPHPWIQAYFRGPRGRAALGESSGQAVG